MEDTSSFNSISSFLSFTVALPYSGLWIIMRVYLATLPIITMLLLLVTPCTADEDLVETFKNIDVFRLRSSAAACPLLVVGQVCPEENPLYYFKCCGDLNSSCCFRLQDWVIVLLLILAVSIVLSIVVNFIRCLCCY
ncbi:hypothetical protein DICVIV_02750 [Dictyocaulus viviparus]|uniref:Uncharacterized protein n=1 Tax=Dictyocaulus viviparus TaxID=29172 RepID=A0A0D8Y2H6_DICVI|nr:hypothetical protein DICVIV_02750 [Dictyocaulus viviparus]